VTPPPDAPGAFPTIRGRSLLGDEIGLPAGLPARRTLVVVAFRQRHQPCVDRWIARAVAAGVPATPRGQDLPMPTAVVEVPALSSRWRPVRRWIDGGMATGIGDPDVLARTITVYIDVGALRRVLSIPDDRDVWAFVVADDGAILATATGEPDDAAWSSVEVALLGA
jgi:hypothetical protein